MWGNTISTYDGVPGSVSRTAPAISGDTPCLGDQNGAHVMAVNRHTGALVWSTRVEKQATAWITRSPVVYNNIVYVGVASGEEGAAVNPAYPCCTFRGSVVALDATTGAILWQTYMVPDNHGVPGGYSGGSVWGSTLVVDLTRDSLSVTTGNNYTVPASVLACGKTATDPSTCASSDDH